MPGTMLLVGAHMDDCENGASGVMLDAIRHGWRVVTVTVTGDFSTWGQTLGREDAVRRQLLDLAERFGYEKRFLDYAYHNVEPDLVLKRRLAEMQDELRPDIGLVHWPEDHWPDHRAVGIAAKDALGFAHGLSGNLQAPKCPRVFAYSATPHQTWHFEPDFYHDLTPVIGEFMGLVAGTDSCLSGRPVEELRANTVSLGFGGVAPTEPMRCTGHGWIKLAECVVWGDQSGTRYPFALGLRTLWGPSDRPLFEDE